MNIKPYWPGCIRLKEHDNAVEEKTRRGKGDWGYET